MSDQLVAHDDGVAEDGVRRLRRPPDWWRSVDASGVETIVVLLPHLAPAIGDEVDIDGTRYRVLNVGRRPDIPSTVNPQARAFGLDLVMVGPSPHDPLLPQARTIVERHGGTVEGLSANREQTYQLGVVSIHAKASWPGRTIDVYGTGENDHEALAHLEHHVERLTR